ncbi:MAG: TIM barrel protein [Candidatus Nanoarchaeia archaeon]
MVIRFGPAGLGPIKEAIPNLEEYHRIGLRACEIAFTYGAYINKKEDAERIGNKAKELGIKLSIHAPYWINLNSDEKEKIEKSKERILECCKIGTWLGAQTVVFHSGFYGKNKENAYENIKKAILDIQDKIKENNYTPKLAPEIMGKVNVFGSIDEIKKLTEETGCYLCIDFAHVLARYQDYKFKEVLEKFKNYKELHIHFSGIVYGEKGEKHHKKTTESELRELISNLPKDKDITVINESPENVEDSVLGLKIYEEIKSK